MCSEGASFLSRFAAECRVFMDGVWVTGRPSGPTCDDYTYPILDEGELKPRAEEFGRQYMGACDAVTSTWSGWLTRGGYLHSGTCWHGEFELVNGVDVMNYGRFNVTGKSIDRRTDACNVSWEQGIVARMNRAVACPVGYRYREVGEDRVECYRIPETCETEVPTQVGNPVLVTSGAKVMDERDYSAGGAGTLRLQRDYKSSGFFLPIGHDLEAPRGFGRLWRFTYDRRLWAVSTSSWVGAMLQTHKGDVLHFDHSGRRIHDQGNDVRLQQVIHPQLGSAWRHNNPLGEREYYDGEGRLRILILSSGEIHTLSYDDEGRLARVRDPFGRQLTFMYGDESPLIRAMLDPAGGRYEYEYDRSGNLVSVGYPDGTKRIYLYDEPGQIVGTRERGLLTGILDSAERRIGRYQYDGAGRVVATEGERGQGRMEIRYSSQSNGPRWVTDSSGVELRYERTLVNGYWRIWRVVRTCPDCGVGEQRLFQYDTRGRLVSGTDWGGRRSEYAHNERGLVTERREGAGLAVERVTSTVWHPSLPLPAHRLTGSLATDYTYDADGRTLSTRRSDLESGQAREWTYAYSAEGLLLSTTERGPIGPVTTLRTYDHAGNLVATRNPLGHQSHFDHHDAHGNPWRIADANGLVTELQYDEQQRLVYQSVGGRVTRYAYDSSGNLERVTLPDGGDLSHAYDEANRLIAITDQHGNRQSFTLDEAGNRIAEELRDQGGQLVISRRTVYDALNRVRTQLGASGQQTHIEYDLAGNPKQRTDALGRTTLRAYDALNRLVETVDLRGGRTALDYDVHDRITRVVDARGVTTTYTYNAFGDLLRESSPDAGTRIYTYDGAGNRITETDARGITRTFSYDALNRLTGVSYPDPVEDVRFAYDQGINGIGRLSTIEDASGSIRLGYNAHGEVVTQVRETGELRFEIRYDHDRLGRIEAIRYPRGALLRLTYDQGGRVSAVSADLSGQTLPLAGDIAYTAFGVLASLQLGNGIRTERRFDADGRLQEARAAPTLHLDLGYDPVGNIVALTDMLDAARSQAFDYDELDRLVSALGAYGFRDYDYDGVGNRLSRESDATQERYDYAAHNNRLLSVTGGPAPRQYMYDENGNTLGDGRFSYTYNQANRLVRVSQAGIERARYTYNALGQRTRKTLPGGGVPGTDREEIDTWLAFHESEIDRLNIFVDELLQNVAAAEAQAHAYDTEANAAYQAAEQAESEAGIHREQAQDYETQSERLELMAAQFRVLLSIAEASGASRSYIATLKRVIADHDRLSAHYQDMAVQARVEADGLEAQAIEFRVMAEHADAQAAALLDEAGRLRVQVEDTREEVLGHAEQVEYWAGRLAAPDHGDGVPSGGVDTHFVYDLDGQLIGEYDSAGEPVREYIYLQGMPLVMLHAGEVYYYHTDHLGTPARITDTQQRVVWDAIQSPFGSLTMITEMTQNPLRFPGQYHDRETGLHYNYFRDYDPAIGRYMQSDPIGLEAGINTYAYVTGNPLLHIDPTGLIRWSGSYYVWGVGYRAIGGATYLFTLTSECVAGQRAMARVNAKGMGIAIGSSPVTNTSGNIAFEDGRSTVNPDVFTGPFVAVAAGAALAVGYGYSKMRLGEAVSEGGWGFQAGFDPGSFLEVSGSSEVVWARVWACDTCE